MSDAKQKAIVSVEDSEDDLGTVFVVIRIPGIIPKKGYPKLAENGSASLEIIDNGNKLEMTASVNSKIKGKEPLSYWLTVNKLPSQVQINKCVWEIQNNGILATLVKVHKNISWNAVLASTGKFDQELR